MYSLACVILGCSSHFQKNTKEKISFHRFPDVTYRKQKWINAVSMSRDNYKWQEGDMICSKHFANFYFIDAECRTLNEYAVPTLHLVKREGYLDVGVKKNGNNLYLEVAVKNKIYSSLNESETEDERQKISNAPISMSVLPRNVLMLKQKTGNPINVEDDTEADFANREAASSSNNPIRDPLKIETDEPEECLLEEHLNEEYLECQDDDEDDKDNLELQEANNEISMHQTHLKKVKTTFQNHNMISENTAMLPVRVYRLEKALEKQKSISAQRLMKVKALTKKLRRLEKKKCKLEELIIAVRKENLNLKNSKMQTGVPLTRFVYCLPKKS
ncbi:DNA transposase THAP9 [Amyelois transitella]|uniref:DNA transposase THAP9 n=1 Tax=Amyelois transitella TaxID=680683 RepID=UPI00067C0671|nr:DNA transposase THAP9 [Amyelois transitella]